MTTDPRDLSALTTPPPGRAAGLAGSLGPSRPTRSPQPTTPAVPAALPDREEQPDTARARKRKPAPARKRPVAVYIPAATRARLRDKLAGDTYSGWVLNAYRRVHEQLGDVFEPADTDTRDGSGLPVRPRGARRNVKDLTPLQLRLTDDELAVLERRRVELGGPSRSAFITAIIDLGLGEHRRIDDSESVV